MAEPTHTRSVILAPPAERLPEAALVAIARASRPRRAPDLRDDLPNPRRVVRDADLPAVTSPMG